MSHSLPHYLLIPEVAKIARAPVETVREWIRLGKLRSTRPGRRRLALSHLAGASIRTAACAVTRLRISRANVIRTVARLDNIARTCASTALRIGCNLRVGGTGIALPVTLLGNVTRACACSTLSVRDENPTHTILTAPFATEQAWQSKGSALPQGLSQHTPSTQCLSGVFRYRVDDFERLLGRPVWTPNRYPATA